MISNEQPRACRTWSVLPICAVGLPASRSTIKRKPTMMVSVLLRLKSSGIQNEYPNLAADVARDEARPAYQRAFEAQLAVNTSKSVG